MAGRKVMGWGYDSNASESHHCFQPSKLVYTREDMIDAVMYFPFESYSS